MKNNFRDQKFCKDFVQRSLEVVRRNPRFNIEKLRLHEQPFHTQMLACLFLLPAELYPSQSFTFSKLCVTSFISIAPTVPELCSRLSKTSDDPHVAVIGTLRKPTGFVFIYQRKVYKCCELWHALDIAVKMMLVYKKGLPRSTAEAWQFLMVHFYNMSQHMQFIIPGVMRLRAIMSMTNVVGTSSS